MLLERNMQNPCKMSGVKSLDVQHKNHKNKDLAMKKLWTIMFLSTTLLWAGSAMAWSFGGERCGPPKYDCGEYPLKDYKDVRSDDVTIGINQSETWLFDLDTDALEYGAVGFEDSIVSAKLDIDIWGLGKSKFQISDDGDGFSLFEKEWVIIFNDVEYNVLAGLQDNHLMNLTISNSFNVCDLDMLVTNVTLSGKYCDAPAPVPEPATMLLFGTGIAGLVGSRIRQKKK